MWVSPIFGEEKQWNDENMIAKFQETQFVVYEKMVKIVCCYSYNSFVETCHF
jgi:hypothetical protein